MNQPVCTRYKIPDDWDQPYPPPSPYEIPSDLKKLRSRIRRYERTLEKEKEQFGHYGDGAGKRFLLGPLYLVMGDLAGALNSFEWFENNFGDTEGESAQLLCWALALLRSGDEVAAKHKLILTMKTNIYVIPSLLCHEIIEHPIWHGCNLSEPSYVNWIPDEFFALWTEEERGWVEGFYESRECREFRERQLLLHRRLDSLKSVPERREVIEEINALAL